MSPADPLISVVIVSYNQGQYLGATIESVVSQTYRHKEVILIDGGSDDSSIDVIKKSARHLSYWVSERDHGQGDAIVKGLGRAQGTIVGWVNSDDLLYPDALSLVSEKARALGVLDAVFFGGYDWIDEGGRIVERYKPELHVPWLARRLGVDICQPGTFFGRGAYLNVGGLDGSLRYAMDRDLFLKFAQWRVPFIRIDRPLAQFRKTSTQKGHSHDYVLLAQRERAEIDSRYGLATGVRRAVLRLARQALRILINYYPYALWFRVRQGRVRQYSIYRARGVGPSVLTR